MSSKSVLRFSCSTDRFREAVRTECGVEPLLRTTSKARGAFVTLAVSKLLFDGVHYELERGWHVRESTITIALSWTCLCKPERMKAVLTLLKDSPSGNDQEFVVG